MTARPTWAGIHLDKPSDHATSKISMGCLADFKISDRDWHPIHDLNLSSDAVYYVPGKVEGRFTIKNVSFTKTPECSEGCGPMQHQHDDTWQCPSCGLEEVTGVTPVTSE